MLLSGLQGPHISAKMGAFGAWHYSHDLHMSPPHDGDPEEHRKVHEGYIKEAKEREGVRRDLQLRSPSIAAVYDLRFLH